jgi:hypothetical protein
MRHSRTARRGAGTGEVYYSFLRKRYENNRSTTQFSDRDQQEYGAALYLRVAPKTYVLGEVAGPISTTKSSSRSSAARSNGTTWGVVGSYRGDNRNAQVRSHEERFRFGRRVQPHSWEGIVTWAPMTYSRLDFYTSRPTNESTGQGRFI